MITRSILARPLLSVFCVLGSAFFLGGSSLAGGLDDFRTAETYQITYPELTASYFVASDAFPLSAAGKVGAYDIAGRLIAAANGTVYLQKNFGASLWLDVATVPERMDPSFIKISPSGVRVALGVGYYQPLYIFGPGVLNTDEPTDLSTAPDVLSFSANYYDAVWLDERYLLINAGSFVGSEVYAIDTQDPDPAGNTRVIVADITGASGGVAVDAMGNVVTGVGYGFKTGQLKIWSSEQVLAVVEGGEPLDYESTGYVLANQALSAASLGFDSSGNLHVGGGDVFGGSGYYGYAVLIDGDVVTRVLGGGAPVDPDDPNEFRKLAPDPCENDDAVGVQFVPGLSMLLVTANMSSRPPDCADTDWSGTGSPFTPIQLYFSPDAPDSDGDGIPDGADNAYLTPNPDQLDENGDGFGDAANVDQNNDGVIDQVELSLFVNAFLLEQGDNGFKAGFDFDRDGRIDFVDYELFLRRYGRSAPFY